MFIKANLPQLNEEVGEMEAKILEQFFADSYSDTLIKESLKVNFNKSLTKDQLSQLITLFSGEDGKDIQTAIKSSLMREKAQQTATEEQNNKKIAFEKMSLGSLFLKIILQNARESFKARDEALNTKMGEDLQKLYAPASMKKIFNEFLAENYKK